MDEAELSPAVFQDLANLEKEFASVELDALRRKEHALIPLYTQRNTIIAQIPSFWPEVLFNGPQEFQSILNADGDARDVDGEGNENPNSNPNSLDLDVVTVSAVKSLQIERFHIQSATEGEPRSLRFVFEFNSNEIFEDSRVVKEFEFVQDDGRDSGYLVSTPVSFKWTKKGKKIIQERTGGILDLAVELYQAERAAQVKVGGGGHEIDMTSRENLWQYEKLREKLEKIEEKDEAGEGLPGSWLDWFGYRGPVRNVDSKPKENGSSKMETSQAADDAEEDDSDSDDDSDVGLLEVEIFPNGEEVAIALAEDLWPNVIDYFMSAQNDPLDDDFEFGEDDEEDEDEEAPELIAAALQEELQPRKRQRTD